MEKQGYFKNKTEVRYIYRDLNTKSISFKPLNSYTNMATIKQPQRFYQFSPYKFICKLIKLLDQHLELPILKVKLYGFFKQASCKGQKTTMPILLTLKKFKHAPVFSPKHYLYKLMANLGEKTGPIISCFKRSMTRDS